MKKIIYSVTSSGIDGRDKQNILYSSYDEDELKATLKEDPNKCYYGITEQIIDIDARRRQALAKLDGVDRLLLGLTRWPSKE